MTTTPFLPLAAACAALLVATTLYGTTTARADDTVPGSNTGANTGSSPGSDSGPSVPPGTEASPSAPVEVDPNDPDLKLPEGATLASPNVLDIKSVVEDQTGDERREDTNVDVTFALQAEVLFGKDSAKLSAEAKARIGSIAEEIGKQNATQVRVFGFTDDLGSAAHGDILSRQRANAVQAVLDQDLNDPDITFEVRGYGEQYPIADNSTEAGRKKNRRVEVSFPRSTG